MLSRMLCFITRLMRRPPALCPFPESVSVPAHADALALDTFGSLPPLPSYLLPLTTSPSPPSFATTRPHALHPSLLSCPFVSPPSYSTCTMERGRSRLRSERDWLGVQVYPSTSSTTTPQLTPTCGTSAAAFSETRRVHNMRDCTPCSSLTHLALPVLASTLR